MSHKTPSQIQALRNEATAGVQACHASTGIPLDLYWAQVDTLCQTLPRVERSKRKAVLEQSWLQWIGGTVPDTLLDYYNMWMPAFYLEESPNSLNLLFTQAGSLIAKLEWGTSPGDTLYVDKMLKLCIKKISMYPEFDAISPKQHRLFLRDLKEVLNRYVTPEGRCTETVRQFFLNNHARYEQALAKLLAKLNKPEAPSEPPVSAPEPPVSMPKPPVSVPADPERKLIEADPEMVGLCAFLEKTSSAVYQRSLAQLYSLYQSPCNQSTGKLAQMALRDFFSALRALRIDPIDEQRFQSEFPEEYAQELRWRNSNTEYVMETCGWSCNDILVIRPVFQKKSQEGER